MPAPSVLDAGDAVVRVDAVTICGTDLHILKGDVPEVDPGRILGHEAVGPVLEVGPAVHSVRPWGSGPGVVHLAVRSMLVLPTGLLETLWIRNVTITTGLVDTSSTPRLLEVLATGRFDTNAFVTHRFGLDEMLEAYDVFGRPSETDALKVALFRT